MNFSNLTPGQKKWAVRGCIVAVILILAIPLYKGNRSKLHAKEDTRVVDIDKHTFEDSILAQTQGDIRDLQKSIEGFKQEYLDKLEEIAQDSKKELDNYKRSLDKTAQKAMERNRVKDKDEIIREIKETVGVSRPKDQDRLFEQKAAVKKAEEAAAARKAQFGIEVSRPDTTKAKKKDKKDDEKSKNTVYLPPGFTEASLLSGAIAPTSNNSGDSQVPMIIRIKNLAVLPNEYKQDIKGCFVIANGQGNLAQERIMTRLSTLSCISKDGKSLIDQPVKGWVVDKDGRAGMRGLVVAKFGAHVARMALAGALKGFGEVFSETSYVTYSGAYGSSKQLKDTDLDTIAQAGVGGSLSTVADDLEDFYLNLAEQTMPVIEVGPTKDITLVFSEGVNLEIKDRI